MSGRKWFWCGACGTPSTICVICKEAICTGMCKHFEEIDKLCPDYWFEDDFDIDNTYNGMSGDKLSKEELREKTNKQIREYNEIMKDTK
jgi:hypothetical protein